MPSCNSPRPATSNASLALRFGDANGDIAFDFAHQTVADNAAGHLVAFGSGQRGVVDREGHGDGGRIDRDAR